MNSIRDTQDSYSIAVTLFLSSEPLSKTMCESSAYTNKISPVISLIPLVLSFVLFRSEETSLVDIALAKDVGLEGMQKHGFA